MVDRQSVQAFVAQQIAGLQDPVKLHYLALTRALLDPARTDRFLDIGCGLLPDAEQLSEVLRAGEVWGIDIIPELIDLARERFTQLYNVSFYLVSGEQLPYSSHFNQIRMALVLQHSENPSALIEKAYNLLKPGGMLAVIEHDWLGIQANPSLMDHQASKQILPNLGVSSLHRDIATSLEAAMQGAGFSTIATTTVFREFNSVRPAAQFFRFNRRLAELSAVSTEDAVSWIETAQAAEEQGEFSMKLPYRIVVGTKRS